MIPEILAVIGITCAIMAYPIYNTIKLNRGLDELKEIVIAKAIYEDSRNQEVKE